jgi:NADPH:quinone reductase-like Zn-dependent oxidoreductase
VGDRVFARVAKDRAGAFAEQACVDEDHAARMPRDLDFTAAAAVPLSALTALQALRDELGVKPGEKVLISGGAGGVGTFAIQIAKWLRAHVTTTASKRGEALVRSFGCDAAAALLPSCSGLSATVSDRELGAQVSAIDVFSCVRAVATSLRLPNSSNKEN